MINDSNDVILAINSERRKIQEMMEEIEHSDLSNDEKDIKLAKLIRQDQYLDLLSKKDKAELEEILSIDKNNDSIPDVFQWYTE